MRKYFLHFFTPLLLGLFVLPVMANDACADAIAITCNTTVEGTTLGSTFDSQPFCGTSNTSPGVWYSFTGTGGDFTLSTCNQAAYDTKISVFSGDCGSLICVAGNDDAVGCSGFTSELTFTSEASTSYLVLVHGFGSATGTFSLTLSCASNSNDECSDATPIACDETVSGSTTDATFDDVGFCGTGNTAPGVWYSFEGDGSEITASTCGQAGYDTKISIFSGSCGSLVCQAGNDDAFGCSGFTSEVSTSTTEGVTYYILVHGFAGATGDFDLTLTCNTFNAENDVCEDAIAIECNDAIEGSTAEAGADDAGFCGTSNTAPGVWYSFTAESNQGITATTCGSNYDTKLSVYDGSCGDLVCVAGDDDDFDCEASIFHSTVEFSATEGTTYYILVHGFGSASGDFVLSLTCEEAPENDDPCAAEALTLGVESTFNNTFASADDGEVSPGAGTESPTCEAEDGWCSFETEVQNSVWFTFTVPASGSVSVSASGFDTQLALWSVDDCGDYNTYTEIAANDDGGDLFESYLELYCLNEGDVIYVQIDGFSGASGDGGVLVEDLGVEELTCDAGGCQSKFVGYEPAEGLNHLLATASGGTPPYSFSWSGDGIVTDPDVYTVSVDPTETTTYTVTVTDANGCTTECSVEVNYVDVSCGKRGNKVSVCHVPEEEDEEPHEICVSYNAVDNHLGEHGDILGYCGNTCLATNPPPPTCVDLSIEILTDDFGFETSWSLSLDGDVIASGEAGDLSSATATTVFEDCVFPGCYTFDIFDTFGDGFCCVFGEGSYTITYDGVATGSPSGGAFGSSESVTFGECDATRVSAPQASSGDAVIRVTSETLVTVSPNPFSNTALINFVADQDAKTTIDIYTIDGSHVVRLLDNDVKRGDVIKSEVTSDQLGAYGIYIYRIQSGDQQFNGKIVYTR